MGKDANVDGVLHGETPGLLEPVKVGLDKLRRIAAHLFRVGGLHAALILQEGPEQGQIHRLGGQAGSERAVGGALRQQLFCGFIQQRAAVRTAQPGEPEGLLVKNGLVGRGYVARHHLHELHVDEPAPGIEGKRLAHPLHIRGT